VAFDAGMDAVHGQGRHDAVVEVLNQPNPLTPRNVAETLPVDVAVKVAKRGVDEHDRGAVFAEPPRNPLQRRQRLLGWAVVVHLVIHAKLNDHQARPVDEDIGTKTLKGAGRGVSRDARVPNRDAERYPEPMREGHFGRDAVAGGDAIS